MPTPPQVPKPRAPVNDPTPNTKLYVNERADRARNQAIGVLGFVALILSIATGLGSFASARNYIDQKINELHLEELRRRAEVAVRSAEADAKTIHEILQKSSTVESRLTTLEQIAAADKHAREERIIWLRAKIDKDAHPPSSASPEYRSILAFDLSARKEELEALLKREQRSE